MAWPKEHNSRVNKFWLGFRCFVASHLVQTVKSPKGWSGKIYPREVLRVITQGTSRGQIFQTIPDDFSLFVRLWASKTEEDAAQSCPMGLSGETVGSDLLKSDRVKSRLRWLKNKVWL